MLPETAEAASTGSSDTVRTRAVQRVVSADLDADGGEIGGESAACLAEPEHRDDRRAHGLKFVESATLT